MAGIVSVIVSLSSGAVQTGLTKIRGQFSKFRHELSGEIGSFLALGGLIHGFETLLDRATKIANISKRFDVAPKEVQRVANAAKDVADLEDVARSFNKLAVNQQKAIRGNEEARKSFADLGIPMSDVVKMSPDQLFYRIADATASAEDRGKAYAAVVAIMGRNAGLLYSTLEKGSGKIQQQGDEMGIMADSTIEKLHSMHLQIEKLKNTLFIYGGGIVTFFAAIFESVGALVGQTINLIELMARGMRKSMAELGKIIYNALHGRITLDTKPFEEILADLKRELAGIQKDYKDIWNPKHDEAGHKEAVDRDVDPTKGETAAVEHIADLKAKLAELERKAANDQLDAQEKINAMIAQRAQLLKEAAGTSDEEKKLNLQIDAEHINQEIITAQKAAAKELESAQDRLDKAKRDRAYDALKTDDDRREFLLKEIQKLEKLIEAERDPTAKTKLQTDREDDLKKLQDLQTDKAPTIAANSLRRIGGQQAGGFSVSGIDDKLLREQTRHGKLLEEIAKNTAGNGGELKMQ